MGTTELGRMRRLVRWIYHRLPVSQRAKWILRERFAPVLLAWESSRNASVLARALASALRTGTRAAPDEGAGGRRVEESLGAALLLLDRHTRGVKDEQHWIALPFLSKGGAQQAAINICNSLRQLRPDAAVWLFLTDKTVADAGLEVPAGVGVLVFDDFLGAGASYEKKEELLYRLLQAVQPSTFHNVNSEVAWHLTVARGAQMAHFTRLYASIFAFQFAQDGEKKIGYAAYFLQQAMPHLAGLLSDNQRFIDDAAVEYGFDDAMRARSTVLYQPCRLEPHSGQDWPGAPRLLAQRHRIEANSDLAPRRPQVLWAGRLDAEKRVDLFLEIVRQCTFADFRVYGQVVLDDTTSLPSLPNLTYEGPFSTPTEWLQRYDFDAFLFTSRWEGMPNVLVEVGALGIPIIAPTVGGVGELVSARTGYPLPERPTVDDYARALRAVIEDPLEALARAERMLDLIRARHRWSAFVEALARVPGYLDPLPDGRGEGEERSARKTPAAQVLVSVIVPCYNQGRYLVECVLSVLAACSHPVEIIIVDDGSTDRCIQNQLAEAEALAPQLVRVHRQANQGLSGARNAGLELARGEFVQFLDADDLLAPGKIDAQVAQLRLNPRLDVSICDFLLCDESRTDFSKPGEAIAPFDLALDDFLYRWERGFAIPIHCGLFRQRVLSEVRFDTAARAKEDWLFWTTLALAQTRFAYLRGHWAMYRQHAASMRRSYVSMGRSWLQAGLKIEQMLDGREPLFFESVVSWFEQCYRAHPLYRQEVAALQQDETGAPADQHPEIAAASRGPDPEAILQALEVLPRTDAKPLISVVIPVYGHYDYLGGCLASLARQGLASMEVICVDDASPDPRVRDLLEALADRHPRLTVRIQAANAGISVTQNLGVSLARGEFVAFLDCDDELETGALRAVAECLHRHPEIDYLFTDRTDIDETGRPVRVARYGGYDSLHFTSQENIRDDLLDGMVASHLKVIRRSAYEAVGGCEERWSGVQDWDLALKLAEHHRLHYLDQPLYRHRVHRSSVTRSDSVAQFRKTNEVRRPYAERWLRTPALEDGRRRVRTFALRSAGVSLVELKACWRAGISCVADARGAYASLGFLREFNSYFDAILWDDPAIPVALYGYLWDPTLVRRFDLAESKLEERPA